MADTSLWPEWRIRHLATHCDGSALSRLVRLSSGAILFLSELLIRRPDLVHLHVSHYGSFARKALLAWFAIIFDIPVVFHVHGSNFYDFFAESPAPVKRLIRLTLERVSAVIVLGNSLRNTILREIAPNALVLVIPNAIRLRQPVSHAVRDPVRVLFLGEICERKGISILIEAWGMLLEKTGPEVRPQLIMAGDGEVEQTRRKVRSKSLADSIDVCGWISPNEVPDLLSTSQVLVLPSLDEGQPMAILEAMSMGLCVVSTTTGEIPEMLNAQQGILVSPGNAAELAEALAAVVQDEAARARYGCNARRRIEEDLNVDVACRRIDEVYRAILASGKRRRSKPWSAR